ncbi:MAG: DUF5317 domain-containing protein [Candidatus Dormibacteraeota bacterium]|nr:DUF5317 domain-containing protein [Candidatus Dormibacteraeota bacterium]
MAAAVAGLLAGLVTGGSLRRLLELRLRWPVVVLAAVIVRLIGVLGPLATSPLTPLLFAASLAALLAWTLWHRDALRGSWLLAIGLALNLAVVLANGGRMPVARAAAGGASSALVRRGVWGQYVLAGPGTRLEWLEDWLRLPPPLDRVFRETYSPGDLVVCLGLGLVFFLATRPPGMIPTQR